MLVRRPFLERMGVNDSHAVYHVDVGKERDTCQIRYEQYRQEPTHTM